MENIYIKINDEVVGIQKLLQDTKNWHEEIEEYLMDNGYIKHVFRRRKGEDEVWFEKRDIEVQHYNDIEVSFTYKNELVCVIERNNDGLVTVRFED